MEDICKICGLNFDVSCPSSWVVLTEKGARSLCEAKERRGDTWTITRGEKVHVKCRVRYINAKTIKQDKRRKSDESVSQAKRPKLRSSMSFDYKTCCLYCTNPVTERDLRERKAYSVMSKNREFDIRVLKACEQRMDELSVSVKGRIIFANDLHASDAVYHVACDSSFRTGKNLPKKHSNNFSSPSSSTSGRPVNVDRESAFEQVITHLRGNDEEQITVKDLVVRMENYLKDSDQEAYTAKWMKQRLLETLKDDIVIAEINGKQDVVTFRTKTSTILQKIFQEQKTNDPAIEKERIILTAAKLLKTEIKETNSCKQFYPRSDQIGSLDFCYQFLPTSLQILLENMFASKDNTLKVSSVGQAIMQAVRPRAIIAPLQLGLAVQVHRQYGSRYLVDVLNKLGFCSSYSEAQKYERSAAYHQGTDISGLTEGSFLQYVADNVDHNIRTIDGLNTFHGMGIIATITPQVTVTRSVPKISVSSQAINEMGRIEIRILRQLTNRKSIKYETLQRTIMNEENNIFLFWQYTWLLKPHRPLWNGFMQTIHRGNHPGQSSIVFLPMIDMKASDDTCILSTMDFVATQAKKYNVSPILTFDQPLYQKAIEIQVNEPDSSVVKNIVLRLGGLHTCMSFLGAIGQLMSSSGLQQILETIYADHTVPHMLGGKAISRAIRGHLLTSGVLHAIIASDIYDCPISVEPIDDQDEPHVMMKIDVDSKLSDLSLLFDLVFNKEVTVEETLSNPGLVDMKARINNFKSNAVKSRTAQLWLQYLEMVEILCTFLKAERTGNFHLHLQTVLKMLPYFASSGHHLYAKSAYIYLQTMQKLETTNKDVYEKFQEGYHIVRRSDRFWGGLSTDLIIEQVLMRSIKTSGGLTRGRGMTEQQRVVWLLSTPSCGEINSAMQQVTDVSFEYSEQHKETTNARVQRDYKDALTIMKYLLPRNPFTQTKELMSIHTGEIADKNVNVEEAGRIGNEIVKSMEGKLVSSYTFKKKARAVVMQSKSTIQVEGESIAVDPQLLFQRLIASVQGIGADIDLETAFTFELCTFPPALIENDGLLRQADKPQLAKAIWKVVGDSQPGIPSNIHYVLDGGSLLHKVLWSKGVNYDEICKRYINYVRKNYGESVSVVFDGYSTDPSTKDVTHLRRSRGKVGRSVLFNKETVLNMKKDDFLLNLENKQSFLQLLSREMNDTGIEAIQSTGDADVLIAKTAIAISKTKSTVVIGEDTDLLILLIHYSNKIEVHYDLFSKSDQKTKIQAKIWDIKFVTQKLGRPICNAILSIHALLGCDTTSRLYSLGKSAALNWFQKDKRFQDDIMSFINPAASKLEIEVAGERLLVKLYGGKNEDTLDQLRVTKFHQKIASSNKVVTPENLCPTSAAATFHSFRVYYQVQCWNGRSDLDPLQWGWKEINGKLLPVYSSKEAAPPSLLKLIRCGCKGDCNKRTCTCLRHNLKCSQICSECKGVSCLNSHDVDDSESDIEVDLEE